MRGIATVMIIAGTLLVAAGLVFMLPGKFPFIGHLPGDIRLWGKNMSFFFPFTTCVILSIALTIMFNIIFRLLNK